MQVNTNMCQTSKKGFPMDFLSTTEKYSKVSFKVSEEGSPTLIRPYHHQYYSLDKETWFRGHIAHHYGGAYGVTGGRRGSSPERKDWKGRLPPADHGSANAGRGKAEGRDSRLKRTRGEVEGKDLTTSGQHTYIIG